MTYPKKYEYNTKKIIIAKYLNNDDKITENE